MKSQLFLLSDFCRFALQTNKKQGVVIEARYEPKIVAEKSLYLL
jgi:hypothetical protein